MKKFQTTLFIVSLLYLKTTNEFTLNNTQSGIPGRDSNKETNQDTSHYDSCIKNKSDNAQPTVLTVLEGKSITLQCDICLQSSIDLEDVIEWYFTSSVNKSIVKTPVLSSDQMTFAQEKLQIFDIGMEQTGRYWCQVNKTKSSPYFLQVYNASEPMRVVRPDQAPNATHAKPEIFLPIYNLKIYTEWTSWSPCSTCDVVGKKVRYGYCTIFFTRSTLSVTTPKPEFNTASLLEIDEYYENENELGLVALEENGMKTKELNFAFETVLPRFGNKLPCRSSFTPQVLQNLPAVKSRESEIMTSYCKIKCQKNVVFEVRDKFGKIIESANNSAGIYSMLQKMPEVSSAATHVTLYSKHNTPWELKCPNTQNSDTPVTWKISKSVVDPDLIEQQSLGRIKINLHGNMVFKKLRFVDSNTYSCWQNKKLAGVFKLKVVKDFDVGLDYYVLIIGGAGIISVFFLVFWRAFQGRDRVPKY